MELVELVIKTMHDNTQLPIMWQLHLHKCEVGVRWIFVAAFTNITWINCNPSMDIINHMHGEVWDEITYPFLNFNGATVEF